MKKLLMTLAAAASLGFVMSCSDEVLEVNLNKDSETVMESFARTGTIEGEYEETLYVIAPGTTQPTKIVYKKSASGNGVVTEEVKDDTYVKETIDGIDFWVRKVVRKTTFTADGSSIKWNKIYANPVGGDGSVDTTYKDYYSKDNTDKQQYTITFGNIEYGMPTLTFGSKTMTKDYDDEAAIFDADDLDAKLAQFDLLKEGDVSFYEYSRPFSLSLTKVGDNTYFIGDDKVTFTGNLEDGNIKDLSLVGESKRNARNDNDAIVKVGAWTDTYKLTITKFERYN